MDGSRHLGESIGGSMHDISFISGWFHRRWVRQSLLILAGGLLTLAFAPYYCWGGGLALTYLAWILNRTTGQKALFGTGFWFGFGLGAVGTGWLAHALMIDGGTYAALIPLCWLGMGLLFGLFWGLATWGAGFYPAGYRRVLALAATLTISEWIRSWFLTGFPWNLTGSVWENTPAILQSASVWGVYGLTCLTVLAFGSLSLWPRKGPVLMVAALMVAVFIGGTLRLAGAADAVAAGIRIRLVQPNIPQTLKWDPTQAEQSVLRLITLSRTDNDSISHVIWPETAVPFPLNGDDTGRALLMRSVRQGGTLITGGLRLTQNPRSPVANSLFILNDMADIIGFYDKAHLVPFGEYMPLRSWLPFNKIVPIPYDIQAGPHIGTLHPAGTPAFGPLICYEVIFSGQVANRKDRPDWLINITNDGWYGLSAGPYQHLGMARMRAVEEGLPVMRAANTGISAAIDPYGRVTDSLALGTSGVLDTRLPLPLAPTLYSRFGATLPVGFCVLLLAFLGIKRK